MTTASVRVFALALALGLGTACAGPTVQRKITKAEVDKQLGQAIDRFYSRQFFEASSRLFAVFRFLPEADQRRDTAQYYLAASLAALGFSQAAEEHYLEIVTARRAPELVGRALGALDGLMRAGYLDEERLIGGLLFGSQYGDLPTETAGFVEYYQALGELRRGFSEWGTRRLEQLAQTRRYYGWKGRVALSTLRLAQGNGQGAEALLTEVIASRRAPRAVKNEARLALARQRYEEKKYEEAFALYAAIDSRLSERDDVLLEQSWDRLADRDARRALGLLLGLDAPIYKRLFAPERALLQGIALVGLCQFRPAYHAVQEFRARYAATLRRIRNRQPLAEDPLLRSGVERRRDLVPAAPWRDRLAAEKQRLERLPDPALRTYLGELYALKLDQADGLIRRSMPGALEKMGEELLAVDEQMSILDYELGLGLFKQVSSTETIPARASADPAMGRRKALFRFDGEYWSDELQSYSVSVDDRCLR